MGSIEDFTRKVAGGDFCGIKCRRRPDGKIVVAERGYDFGEGEEWCGSVSEWQAALLVALSAKSGEASPASDKRALLIEPPRDLSLDEKGRISDFAMTFCRETKRQVVVRASAEEEPLYSQFTDWVRAQPSGVSILAVFQNDEQYPAIQAGDNEGKLLGIIDESELVETLASGREYSAVWLSRYVDPSREAKIPRGVKVYRER